MHTPYQLQIVRVPFARTVGMAMTTVLPGINFFGIIFFCTTFLDTTSPRTVNAQIITRPFDARSSSVDKSSLKADASLHAVRFFNSRTGWAMGDRGVVWKTNDGGSHWQAQNVSVSNTCRWNDACFLSEKLGWIAGGSFDTPLGSSKGVLFKTIDGGKNWKRIETGHTGEFFAVRFFNLQKGLLAGVSSPTNRSGLLQTSDGGKTWTPLVGKFSEGWRTAHFFDEETAIVAGRFGRQSVVGNGRLLASGGALFGTTNIQKICFSKTDNSSKGNGQKEYEQIGYGWMVGQGGLLLRTENLGVTWRAVPFIKNRTTQALIDLRAVAAIGKNEAWVSGSPAKFIWHTTDGGKTWERQSTGLSGRIHAIHFSSRNNGCAVGDWGTILVTRNGGTTWTAVQGKDRRLGLLTIASHLNAAPLKVHALYGLENGYRSATVLLPRYETTKTSETQNVDLRLHASTVQAGGGFAEVNWTLPVDLPNLDSNRDQLARYWHKKTDGRLGDIVIGRLVMQIRSLKPEVIILDSSPHHSATAALVSQAVLNAVKAAGDPTQFLELQAEVGLDAWKVRQVFQAIATEKSQAGQRLTQIDPFQYLPRQKKSISQILAQASRPLQRSQARHPEAIRLSSTNDRMGYYELKVGVKGDPFAGSVHMPGSTIRRPLSDKPLNDSQQQRRIALAQKERNYSRYAKQAILNPAEGSKLIAQVNDFAAGRTPADAARQFAKLAEEYRRAGQFANAQAICEELIQRYPKSQQAQQASVWLLQLLTSEELCWQRLQKQSGLHETFQIDKEAVQANWKTKTPFDSQVKPTSGGYQQEGYQTSNPVLSQAPRRDLVLKKWKERATQITKQIEANAPDLFAERAVQFSRATLSRQRSRSRVSDEIYRQFKRNEDVSWSRAARSELWLLHPVGLAPKSLIRIPEVPARPYLDAKITEPCWEIASEVRLTTGAKFEDTSKNAVIWTACDREYLYLAAMVPRHPDLSKDAVVTNHRQHDADLSKHDRLQFCFDIDRDYATYYTLEVDSRGQTTDSCWTDSKWNPKWFVAAKGDEKSWRVEIAIPWTELVSQKPKGRQYWNISITRIMPTVGIQSWAQPSSLTPLPQNFGFAKFD